MNICMQNIDLPQIVPYFPVLSHSDPTAASKSSYIPTDNTMNDATHLIRRSPWILVFALGLHSIVLFGHYKFSFVHVFCPVPCQQCCCMCNSICLCLFYDQFVILTVSKLYLTFYQCILWNQNCRFIGKTCLLFCKYKHKHMLHYHLFICTRNESCAQETIYVLWFWNGDVWIFNKHNAVQQ